MESARVRVLVGTAAVGFAIFTLTYLVLVDVPDLTSSNAETIAFWQLSSHRTQALVGAYAALAAAVMLLTLALGLLRLLPDTAHGWQGRLSVVAAGVFVALHLTAAALFSAPAFALSLNNEHVTVDDSFALFARSASAVGDSLFLLFAGFAAALFVGSVTWEARRVLLPTWMVVLGVLTTVVLLAPLPFFSLLFLLLWAVALGVTLLVRRRSGSSIPAEPPATVG